MKHNPKKLTISKALSLASAILLSAASVQAADKQWIGGTASYNLGSRWNGTGVPAGGDNAINNSGAANTVLISAADPNWTVNDIRSGDGGANQGPWLQTGANVTLNGWFRIGIGSGVGKYEMSGGALTVNAARFNVGEGGTATFNFTGGTITKNGGGDLAVPDGGTGVMNQTNGTLNVASGEFWIGQGGSANGTYNLASNGVIMVNDWVAIGRGGGTGVLNISDNASVTKAGANSFIVGASGPGTINQNGGAVTNNTTVTWIGESGTGIWNLNTGNDALATVILGVNGGSSGTLNLNGGTFAANQITAGTGSSAVNFNGATLRARVASTTFMTGAPGFLQAGGAVIDTAGNNVTISSSLADGAGGGLTKVGNGTLTLSGFNNYVGATTVSAGKLIEDSTSLVTSSVTVANAAGYGVNVSVASTQASHGNVTLSGAANTLDFLLGGFGNPTLAPLNVTGTLSVSGTTTVNISDSLPQVGPIPLISFVSRAGVGNFVLGTLPAGVSASIRTNLIDYANPTIELVISSTALIRWDGEVAGGVWDINTTTNWTGYLSSLPAKFTTGAAVFFDDLALGTTTANLGVAVAPGSISITNDALAYTITGTGSINGTTGLTKQGTNSLTIGTTNGYTGVTTISGGTVIVSKLANGGLPSGIGSGSTNPTSLLLDGGTLSYTGPATTIDRGYSLTGSSTLDLQNDLTINGAVSPSIGANFAKTGPGTLSFKRAGANTLTAGGGGGAFNIVNGTVVMDGSAGGQVNTITGEIWPGAAANSTGGNLILTNTTVNMSSWLAIARGTGTGGYTSSVTLYNSALKSVNMSLCFDAGIASTLQTGLLTLNGTSTFTNNGDGNLSESAGGTAIISLNDSSIFYNNNRLMVGWHTGATATMTIANSAKVVVNSWISIGNEGGVGSVVVKDTGNMTTTADLNVCDVNAGTGNLLAKDNSTINAGNIYVGKGNGSTGTFTITNTATVVSANGITLASGNATSLGTVNLSGGSLSVNLVQGLPGSGTVNFNGGTLIAHPPYFGSGFVFNLAAANVLAGGAVIEIDNSDVRNIPQALLDGGTGGGLTKLGTGTLLLDGINTYTGSTAVSAGALGGNGTIAGNVSVASTATLSPSASAGINTLTINGNLAIVGNVAVAVNKTNTPSTNDYVVVSGTLSNTGTGTVKVTNLSTNAVQVGDSFTLFSKPVSGGAALTVLPSAGVVWTNKLAIDGSIQAVAIIAPPVVVSGGVSVTPSGTSLTATGVVGSTYKLWGTTNLLLAPIATTWQLINSGTVTTSPFTVTDSSATNSVQKFYIFSTP